MKQGFFKTIQVIANVPGFKLVSIMICQAAVAAKAMAIGT